MYKIGTGEFGTIAGKVYLYACQDKEIDGCWVYCKEKLYLRRTSEEIGLVSIICPITFKKLGTLKLCCEEAFKETATLKYNKSMPLLTDGDNLFAVTMQVKTIKRKLKSDKQDEYEKLKKDEEEGKRRDADKAKSGPAKKPVGKDIKKEEKKFSLQQQLSDTAKICEFNLVEFDVNSQKDDSEKNLDPKNEALIEELYFSFSGYFTKKECAYALRINKGDMQNAAHWLVDEGENERGKVVIIAKSSCLLAQSIVKPGLDIDVQDDSILVPYNVTNGIWTMTKNQVTLHSNYPHAKIFSTNPSHIKPLPIISHPHSKSKKKKQEIIDDSEQLPAFVRRYGQTSALGFEERSPVENGYENLADTFFEEIELKGTFIGGAPMEYLQYDHTSLVFDNIAHKFYILYLNDSTIGVMLEYGDYAQLNLSTLPKGFLDHPSKSIENPMISLIDHLFNFLKINENMKYCLPWRWDLWDTLYSKMSDFLCMTLPPEKEDDPQWKKANSKLMRLKQRFEKTREIQELKWIEQFGLKKLKLAPQNSIIRQSKSIPLPTQPPKEILKLRPREGRPHPPIPFDLGSMPRHAFRPDDYYRGRPPPFAQKWDIHEENAEYLLPDVVLPPKPNEKPPLINKPKITGKSVFDYVPSDESPESRPRIRETKQKTQVVRENKKMRPFCSIGSLKSLTEILELIKNLMKESGETQRILIWLFDNLLICIQQMGVLASAPQMGYTEKLEELTTFLINLVTQNENSNNEKQQNIDILSYAWRILIHGWSILIRTAEKQSFAFQAILKSLPYFKNPILNEFTKQTYYQIMLNPNSTPLQLFCAKHTKYPSSFFLDYPMRQSNVQIFNVYEVTAEQEKKSKGPKHAKNVPLHQIKFVENNDNKEEGGHNQIIDMCCDKEIWPKLSGLLLRSTEEVENNMMNVTGLTIDNVIAFYSSVKINPDKTIPDEEMQKHKKELVAKLREQHNSRIEKNWELLIAELLKEPISVSNSLIWKSFNKLLMLAAEEVSAKGSEMIDFTIRCFNLLESLLAKFKEIIKGEKEPQPLQLEWIENFLEHLFWVSTLIHIGQGYVWETEYAVKIMPKMMSLLYKLKEIISDSNDSSKMLIASNSFSENIDYSHEKIFETPHPYGRGETVIKEYAHFPYAVAICCEFDARCQTENSSDYIQILTSETPQNIWNGIGTSLRLSGRPAAKSKYILIGDKAMIEFRVTSQPRKKEDVACRWGYKVTLRPIYGEPLTAILKKDSSEQKLKQMIKINLMDHELVQLLTATNNFVSLASRLISSLMKGVDLNPEEANYRELFSLPIMKEGLKTKNPPVLKFDKPEISQIELQKTFAISPQNSRSPSIISERNESEQESQESIDLSIKSPEPKPVKKVYQLKREILEPNILRSIDDCENNSGWLPLIMHKIRTLVPIPNQFAIELKRPSFEKKYQEKWALTERYIVLALIYHLRCIISNEGAQVTDQELQKIGQSVNTIIQWMLSQLFGEKDYYILRVSVLEECNQFYQKYKEKKIADLANAKNEEIKKKEAEDKKAEEIKSKKEEKKSKRKKGVKVEKSGPSKTKKVKFEKPIAPKPEDSDIKLDNSPKTPADIKISELSDSERKEFKQKLYQQIYDTFLQRYQGNFDLVKGLCGVLAIEYTANDPAEALKKIFKRLQEDLKDIIDLSGSDSLPENIEPTQLQTKNPYEIVADHVIERAKFLFECKRLEKKPVPQSQASTPTVSAQKEEPSPKVFLLPPLDLQRSSSLQPFLQDAKTPEEMQKAVDSYLKWKRAKIAMDEELMSSDSPLKAVVTLITGFMEPVTLKQYMKLQQRRGLLRKLGLGYQYELMALFNKTMFKRHIIGNASDSLLYGPFSFIEGSGAQITGPIASHSLKLCSAMVETLREDCGKFKEIKRAVKKMSAKNPDNKGMDENCISEHMKRLLLVFSDLTCLLQGATNNNLIINLCTASTTRALSEFLASIVDIILMSQSYSAELQSNPPIAKLNSYLISSCQVILNRFLISAQEISAPEAKSSIQQLLLQIFVDTLRRECGLSKPIKDVFLRFESPLYQQRFTQLLSFLYEILVIFEKITDIDHSLLQKCASLLCYLLHISPAPCIVRLASKCAQLLYKFIDVDSIQTEGIIPLPSITNDCKIAESFASRNNIVAHTLRRIGQFSMMRNVHPASEVNGTSNPEYFLIINMNSNENDATFLLTALFHWESIHPFFTETYPQTPSADMGPQKESEYASMFSNTHLWNQTNSAKTAPKVYSAAILQIEKVFDEIVKMSYEEIKQEDTETEKMRKLNEKNYNRRIKQHIQDAKVLTAYLLTRSFVQFPLPLSYERAMELYDIVDKAYNKQLDGIPMNPFMKVENRVKKTSLGVSIESCFPLTYKKPPKAPTQSPPPPPIIIAKPQIILSICESKTYEKIESYLDMISVHVIQNRHKSTLEGTGLEAMRNTLIIGASFSLTLHEHIQLLRSMLDKSATLSWTQYITNYLNKSLELLSTTKWADIGEEDKEIICGCLVLVGGWTKCVRPGTQVEANVNNNKAICTVVSGGYGTGKHTVTVIVKGDDSFVTHKIPLTQVKPYEEYQWPESVELSDELIIKALLNSHQQCLELKDASKTFSSQLIKFIRVLILKLSAGRNWTLQSSPSDLQTQFINILSELSKESNSENIKSNCEEKMLESWERLIEIEDKNSKLFYVPKRRTCIQQNEKELILGKIGESKSFLEYVQPMSSYLKSLPGKLSDAHASEEAALKLLNYWEKNLIPKIQDFVRSSYKPWEMVYYFEQLRDRLRKGDINKAMEDALDMCDRRLPSGCVPPDENQDWSAFITEECIPGTWAKAKVKIKKGAQSSHPLVSRLIKQKITELAVLIKIADWRKNIALCEYRDLDSMHVYPMIFPINSLKELESPLLSPPSSCAPGELFDDFSKHEQSVITNYALKTLISLWGSNPSFKPIFKQVSIPEILHWIVMDELNDDRVEGWLKLASPLIELEGLVYKKSTKANTKKNLLEKALREINKSPTEGNHKDNLKKIESLMIESVHNGNLAEITELHKWCLETWKKLSVELSENRYSLNLTDASEICQRADAAGQIELSKEKDGNTIFPLHNGIKTKTDIGALIISFEMNAFLSPNSKLKFHSDPQGLNCVHQIIAGKDIIQAIPPIKINDGKVWCHVHQGTIANLPLSAQEKIMPSSLPCCVYFIPASWSTACWLTETLSTALLGTVDLKVIENYYKPLVSTICDCVSKSKAPSILKQLSFMLINRLLRKMRFIYNSNPYVPGSSIEKLGLNIEWLKSLISELTKLRDNEDMGEESLYSEFIQNGAELMASALQPFKSKPGETETLDQKLLEQLKIPVWLRSVLSVGIFLNYFRGEGQMTSELRENIFAAMNLAEPQKKNIILVRGMPKTWDVHDLKKKIITALTLSRVRIVNPDNDIIFPRDESSNDPKSHVGECIMIIDGFDMSLGKKHDQEESGNAPVIEAEPVPEPPPEPISLDWNCAVCTLLNPASRNNCDACGAEKPASPILPQETEVKIPEEQKHKKPEADKLREQEESEMWKDLIESLKNIGMKPPKEQPPPPPSPPEEKKEEVKKEAKKEHKKEVKKQEAKKEDKKPEEKKKDPPEYDFHVDVITNPLQGEMDRFLYQVLKARLGTNGPTEFTFSQEITEILNTIFDNMQKKPHTEERIILPKHEFVTNIGLTSETIGTMSKAEFIQQMITLATCDPWLVWELLALQGYDLWLMKGGYAFSKEMPEGCSVQLLEEMVKLCEVDICNETKSVMRLMPVNLRFYPVDKPPLVMINGLDEIRLRPKHPKILSLNLEVIRYNWALIKTFNENLIKAIPYINWTMCVNSIPENSIPLTLSSFLSSARSLCFNYVKICLQQAVLDQTAVPRDRPPKLYFERLKLAKAENNLGKEAKKSSEESLINPKGKLLSESMLYRAYEQVKELDLTLLRPTKPQGSAPFLAFEIVFKGENVAGEGGPYRQFFADISSELQPSATSATYTDTRFSGLHLLCPTPNSKSKQGEGHDKYTFTPSAKSTIDLSLYEFIGILMGCCIRTGVRLSLNLPSIIWKQIVGEPVNIYDLEGIDSSIINMIQYVTKPEMSPPEFSSTFTENFTAMLSDETTVELIPNGTNISVTYDRREEYAELLLKTRFIESTPQCKAVRKGISLVVPIALLNFLTYQEVEALVCGKPVVDIELLKRHTRYSAGLSESSDRVKLFWEVLKEFNEIDKLRFIKFCWGQERLPATDEEYERRQVRFMIKPSVRKGGNEEAALPKASTCFFNLELPNYKSKGVMKERLLLAIHTDDVSMNAEDNPSADQNSGEQPVPEDDEQ